MVKTDQRDNFTTGRIWVTFAHAALKGAARPLSGPQPKGGRGFHSVIHSMCASVPRRQSAVLRVFIMSSAGRPRPSITLTRFSMLRAAKALA